MEAGRSSRSTATRKRKSAALEVERYPAPAPPAAPPDPGAAEHDGCGDGRDLHHIRNLSDLPDDMLRKIISLLPIKERGRTQILARRWRPLWRSLPLNIDCDDMVHSNNGKLGDVLQRIISSHQGVCHHFCIRPELSTDIDNDAAVEACLLSSTLDKLKELEFYRRRWHNWQPVPVPALIFRFSPTLCVAKFGHFTLADDALQGIHFPQLKKLVLHYVYLSDFSLNSMIARSPSLEFLLIIRCTGARRPRINSFTLTTIAVDNHSPDPSIKELVIESAPHLQTLIHLDHNHDLHIAALSVPKLETLGCTNSTRLVFGSTDIRHHQGPCIRGLATAACKIKCLVLGMATLNLHMVIELMTNFPCLEKLYIQGVTWGDRFSAAVAWPIDSSQKPPRPQPHPLRLPRTEHLAVPPHTIASPPLQQPRRSHQQHRHRVAPHHRTAALPTTWFHRRRLPRFVRCKPVATMSSRKIPKFN
ncbi:hypothetical protein ZWY2020_046488 [Hordeum vulgare]|nr:hypothetical protein ZWY2020_046488 [Hordeum vulgare]